MHKHMICMMGLFLLQGVALPGYFIFLFNIIPISAVVVYTPLWIQNLNNKGKTKWTLLVSQNNDDIVQSYYLLFNN